MTAPATFASVKRALGFAKEVTPGTPVVPVAWLPVEKMDWNDKPTWLEDKGLRGVMAQTAFGIIQGVEIGELTVEGAVYGDEFCYILGNLFGQDDTTGSSAPYTHKFSLLNSLSGQGTTHTLTQYYGVESTHNARVFAGAVFTDFTMSFNVETELLKYTAKAMCWVSQLATATPTPTFTSTQPIAGWKSQLGLGGTVGGNPVLTVNKGEFSWKRQAKAYFTAQNIQNPYIIQRGELTSDWKLTFVAADESPLTYMRNNTQPQVQHIIGNGGSGAGLIQVQTDIQAAAFKEAKPNFGEEAILWDASGTCVLNTTNTGSSGGYGPSTITVQNAIASGTFV